MARREANRSGTAAQHRRSRQEIEAEEKRSRMTTIAIVACSAVAVIGIVIFLIALMSGAFFNQESELAKVPDLIGDIYYSGMTVDGFLLDAEHAYNDEYEKGQIYHQNPDSGLMIEAGSTIKVMVSLGEEPLVKYMENLQGQTADDAKAFLTGQGMNPLVLDGGFSDLYKEGTVIRTEPEVGAELTDGQTVYIYVSAGPEIITDKMPDVVGMNYATAYNLLYNMGFTTIEPKYVESDEDKDEVVEQSIAKGTEVDLTTKIVLSVSNGPKETTEAPTTEEPTEAPTEETTEATTAPTEKTKVVTIMLENREEAYILSLYHNGQEIRESTTIQPGTQSIEVELTGTGIQTYEVYINGEKYQTIEVDFDS